MYKYRKDFCFQINYFIKKMFISFFEDMPPKRTISKRTRASVLRASPLQHIYSLQQKL